MDRMNFKRKWRRKLTHFVVCSLLIYISRSFYLNPNDPNNQADVSWKYHKEPDGLRNERQKPMEIMARLHMQMQDMATRWPSPVTLNLKPTQHLRCRCSSSHLHTKSFIVLSIIELDQFMYCVTQAKIYEENTDRLKIHHMLPA